MNAPTTLDAIVASVRRPISCPTAALPANVFPLESRTKAEVETAQTKWPQLDDSFLDSTYHDAKCGGLMPCFAVLSLFNASSTICVHARAMHCGYGGRTREADFNREVTGLAHRLCRGIEAAAMRFNEDAHARHPNSVWSALGILTNWAENVYLTYRFTGLMPDRTRQIATEAKAEFGDNLFLVCDAKDAWVRTKTAPADVAFPKRDPLLIGAKVVHGVVTLFLLDKFDVTLAEDYLTREFTS
jgi:hypothetical protein